MARRSCPGRTCWRGSRHRTAFSAPERQSPRGVPWSGHRPRAPERAARVGDTGQRSHLLHQLNQVLRGWTAYFEHGSSKATFTYLRAYTWKQVFGWLRRKHRRTWVQLVFLRLCSAKERGPSFSGRDAHGGCGRRSGETHRRKRRQGAPGRPHLVPTRDHQVAEQSKNYRFTARAGPPEGDLPVGRPCISAFSEPVGDPPDQVTSRSTRCRSRSSTCCPSCRRSWRGTRSPCPWPGS
ncbi:group II intron maturase-specific domain-containing protein [Streptomyces canus]|uniref:group II intron maturase-specific domain-containing protein n=1 Tax=Streptomyces canus TaxID=58343 RepID=UPI000997E576|nr:group II intron maturase-specific domain-containing protein [Streptomyces canus]